ncbi:MAG: hypothetical protein QOF20_3342, partial [Acidimicrobiaceae bacterium]|nr:hypothetical protein [Acidimicrobiaceae bacterium]
RFLTGRLKDFLETQAETGQQYTGHTPPPPRLHSGREGGMKLPVGIGPRVEMKLHPVHVYRSRLVGLLHTPTVLNREGAAS